METKCYTSIRNGNQWRRTTWHSGSNDVMTRAVGSRQAYSGPLYIPRTFWLASWGLFPTLWWLWSKICTLTWIYTFSSFSEVWYVIIPSPGPFGKVALQFRSHCEKAKRHTRCWEKIWNQALGGKRNDTYRDGRFLPVVVGIQIFLELQYAELHFLQQSIRDDLERIEGFKGWGGGGVGWGLMCV